ADRGGLGLDEVESGLARRDLDRAHLERAERLRARTVVAREAGAIGAAGERVASRNEAREPEPAGGIGLGEEAQEGIRGRLRRLGRVEDLQALPRRGAREPNELRLLRRGTAAEAVD